MKLTVEKITPTKAEQLLRATNPRGNHPAGRVEAYARMMRAGQWKVGPTIAIDEDGKLLDGFGRLQAVILAGRPQEFAVIRDFPAEAVPNIDAGKVRDPAALLRNAGIDHHKTVRSLVSGIVRLPWRHAIVILNGDYLPLYELYAQAIDPLESFFVPERGGMRRSAMVAFCRGILAQPKDRDRIVEALRKVVELDFIPGDDEPLRLLAQYLRNTSRGKGKQQVEDYLKAARALDAWLREETVRCLKVGPDPFPTDVPF